MQDIYYRTNVFEGLTLRGASRASIQTFWNVPEFDLGFDVGAHPWDFTASLGHLFVTHTHRDHVAALYYFITRRRKLDLPPPEIYVPNALLDVVKRFLDVWEEMDGRHYPYVLHGISPGETVTWQTKEGRTFKVEALATHHRIPSLGYAVYENDLPCLAFTGDTLPQALDENPVFYQAKILITEMTSADDFYSLEEIHHFNHIHFEDILERELLFKNQWIVVAHFTCKERLADIHSHIQQEFPDRLGGRLIAW